MPQFSYKALDQSGKATDGHIDAPTEPAAIAKLRSKALYVLEIQATALPKGKAVSSTKTQSKFEKSFSIRMLERHQPISSHEQIFFFRQLAVMLQSGLPLLQSLEVCQMHGCEKSGIQKRNDNGDFRSVEVLAVAPDFEGSV